MRFISRCADLSAAFKLCGTLGGRGRWMSDHPTVAVDAADDAAVTLRVPGLSARWTMPAQVERRGGVMLGADGAARLAGLGRDGTADCGTDGERLRVVNGSVSMVDTLPADTAAPDLFASELEATISGADGPALMDALLACSRFVAKETTRYAFSYVAIDVSGGRARALATDGRRMHIVQLHIAGLTGSGTALIPLTVADKLARVWRKRGAFEFAYRVDDDATHRGELRWSEGAAVRWSIVEPPQFPPYEDVIPRELATTVTAGREELLHNIEAAAKATTEECKGVRLQIGAGIVWTVELGGDIRASGAVPCRVDGRPLTIGFNAKFLAEALDAMPGDEVTIGLNAPNRPMLMEAGRGGYATHVLMPVNLAA